MTVEAFINSLQTDLKQAHADKLSDEMTFQHFARIAMELTAALERASPQPIQAHLTVRHK